MDNQDEHAVQLPEQPVDPTVHLPPALAFPPNEAAVFQAIKYLEEDGTDVRIPWRGEIGFTSNEIDDKFEAVGYVIST